MHRKFYFANNYFYYIPGFVPNFSSIRSDTSESIKTAPKIMNTISKIANTGAVNSSSPANARLAKFSIRYDITNLPMIRSEKRTRLQQPIKNKLRPGNYKFTL